MNKLKITPSKASKYSIKIAKDGISRNANEILTQKGVDMSKIREIWPKIPIFTKEIDDQIEINAHYRGYLKKQKKLKIFTWQDRLMELLVMKKQQHKGL